MESLQNPAAGRNSMQKLVQNNEFWAGMSKASCSKKDGEASKRS